MGSDVSGIESARRTIAESIDFVELAIAGTDAPEITGCDVSVGPGDSFLTHETHPRTANAPARTQRLRIAVTIALPAF